MSQIQSSVGLITGIPIEDTVNQLLSIAGRQRNLLQSRTDQLQSEQVAVDRLASLTLSFQFAINKFKNNTTFASSKASSSNKDALAVTVQAGKTPAPGSYQIKPVQTAAAQQLLSGRFDEQTSSLGDGVLKVRFGGQVDQGVKLDQLNSGAGVPGGSIKITDRSGATAVIDLKRAQTVDDVIEAINAATEISVTASTDGDSFSLTDLSGGSGSLSVQEVAGGKTAAGLGLAGLSVASNTAVGTDVLGLSTASRLKDLNDGNGVSLTGAGVDDLSIQLSDGADPVLIDLADATTLGQVVNAINAAAPGRLSAAVSADGARLELQDLSGGAGAFTVASAGGGTAAEDLGVAGDGAGATLSGRRLIGGLRGTLVSSLNGGRGVSLGAIEITDRAGAATTQIDLSGAETLSDIVNLINASGAQVTASINSARNGVQIVDASGGSGALVVADVGAGATAQELGIAVNDTVASINSGSLNRQVASRGTLLTSLNGGKGVPAANFRVTNSAGVSKVVDLKKTSDPATTLGDVIDRVNALGIDVEARINDSGDGIVLTDLAGGSGTLSVAESGGKAAAGLRLLGSSTAVDGSGRQVIDGTTNFEFDLSDLSQTTGDTSLSSLRNGAGIALGLFRVTASNGSSFVVNLSEAGNEAQTVGDVINKINSAADAAGVSVTAALNAGSNGITLSDSSPGGDPLKVEDLGSGASATQLGIAKSSTSLSGAGVRTVDSGALFTAADAKQGALGALASKINKLDAGFSASVLFDGVGYRLSVQSAKTGAGPGLLLDSGEEALGFEQVTKGRDALIEFGGGGVLIASKTNSFTGVVDGLSLTVNATSDAPARVDVSRNNDPISAAVKDFVDSFNALRTNLDSVTDFDSESNTTGILFGKGEPLRVESELGRLLSGRFATGGRFETLQSIGVSLKADGSLELDSAKLESALTESAADVESLLRDPTSGVAVKFTASIDRLAGDDNSLLLTRSRSLTVRIDSGTDRVAEWDERLTRQRDQMLAEFYRLEETIAKLQTNQSTLNGLQIIPPL
ncbi:Flagellar hook-associated protein 2 [Pirellulimonas nuda]|uniref:Filament cap protein n=1 Tax=Pirellulimonas nuda TaxID=2528009 RepID=A0A518DJT2_9BACT|nr:flagellar filament capping protein FliD [Pirellulimonas nuda]QDU91731.1 Flagellar hook-associated protein 2 [Pirellulimonas nuda]